MGFPQINLVDIFLSLTTLSIVFGLLVFFNLYERVLSFIVQDNEIINRQKYVDLFINMGEFSLKNKVNLPAFIDRRILFLRKKDSVYLLIFLNKKELKYEAILSSRWFL